MREAWPRVAEMPFFLTRNGALEQTPLPGPSEGGKSRSCSWGTLCSPWAFRGGAEG